jgi:hypothetical protein
VRPKILLIGSFAESGVVRIYEEGSRPRYEILAGASMRPSRLIGISIIQSWFSAHISAVKVSCNLSLAAHSSV